VFTGFVPDNKLVNYYSLCDLFVLVSRPDAKSKEVEGFGIVFLEANACYKAVVGSAVGGITDAVIDGVTGRLVADPTDPTEIASVVIELLKNNGKSSFLGTNGRRRVENLFSEHKRAEELISLLTCQ
jgi:phosphatidylinositol alpha-1,6-mannosyltransferase